MSAPAKSMPGWQKMTCLFAGLALVLGSLYGMYDTGAKAYRLWKQAHPAAVAAAAAPTNSASAKMPKPPGAAPAVPVATPAVKPHISVDAVMPLAEYFIGELIGLFIGVWVLQLPSKKAKQLAAAESVALEPVSTVAAKTARASAKRWQSCNVLEIEPDKRRLWSFGAGKGGFNLTQEQSVPTATALPVSLVGRDWKVFFQPKLNIAWLPVEQVFLRVAQLPLGEFEETLAMVELQLEKLSPLPVTQIVWSVQILPQRVDNLQTVIVIIMARDLVEKFLGDLEGQGFLTDRLELPILDQMQATAGKVDGAYIYPDNSGKFSALVAWWYGGTLRSLGLVHVAAGDGRDAVLEEQLTQMAWSGELEGWLDKAPKWFLVADEDTAAVWEPMFRPWLGHALEVIKPVPLTQLATLNANRAARAEAGAGILPPEYALRYQQEFVDRLWMRGVGALLGAYILGVIIYMAGASIQNFRAETLAGDVASRSRAYTNVLQLKAQLEILQNRQALKFASLDCWKKTAELLPENISVGTLEFKDGKNYSLSGTAPGDASPALTDFNEALSKATLNGQLMFESLTLPTIKLNPGGTTLSWGFNGSLARAEEIK